jgi:hypothetical protein
MPAVGPPARIHIQRVGSQNFTASRQKPLVVAMVSSEDLYSGTECLLTYVNDGFPS